jgi:hypothetical protein
MSAVDTASITLPIDRSRAISRYVPGLWLTFGSRNLFARNRLK